MIFISSYKSKIKHFQYFIFYCHISPKCKNQANENVEDENDQEAAYNWLQPLNVKNSVPISISMQSCKFIF